MKSMRKSKCVYCVDGIVLNEDCSEIVADCYCAIDEWDSDTKCRKGYCNYYRRMEESEVRNDKNN
jgi:hypothetical protein